MPVIINHAFTGIVINLPKEHSYEHGHVEPFGGFTYIPVCGAYNVHRGDVPGGTTKPLILVAVDVNTKQVYRGRNPSSGNYLPPPPVVYDLSDFPHFFSTSRDKDLSTVGGTFNFNLASVVRLPEYPAEYIVYARQVLSNQILEQSKLLVKNKV